jgi:hypothetical protein
MHYWILCHLELEPTVYAGLNVMVTAADVEY